MARAKKTNTKRRPIIAIVTFIVALLAVAAWYLHRTTIPVLEPAGPIAAGERRMLVIAFLLMLIVVVPVFVLTFSFAWRYRESNHKAKYSPNWDHSRTAETIWWVIPSLLITVLAVMTWHGTYQYDPYKTIASKQKNMTIQVVALDWRWLFIYPDQHVASMNQVEFPKNTPVTFQITSDTVMNSFWIPQLGGQIYAMPGMTTKLNLLADRTGTFYGSSANISGKGFASMHFNAKAVTQSDFNEWVKKAQAMPQLTVYAYDDLSQQSSDTRAYVYAKPTPGIFQGVINKYMMDEDNLGDEIDHSSMKDMEGM